MKFGPLLPAGNKLTNFWGADLQKQDSVLAQTFHGPSVSENETPVKIFYPSNLPFQQKKALSYVSYYSRKMLN